MFVNFYMFQCPSTVAEWLHVAQEFEELWNFPNCIGALDGKHVPIRKPACSGAKFFNYKHFYSVILLAVCDAQHKFLFIDIGSQGRCADGGVFAESHLNEALQKNILNIPEKTNLPGTNIKFPYCLVADEAFPLRDYILKPYPHRKLSKEQRVYNYRLSRARRCVESGFGIMSTRFRVLMNPILVKPAKVDVIVQACCALHNMLRTMVPYRYSVVDDDINDESQGGKQPRTSESTLTPRTMSPARVSGRRSASQSAKKYRDTLCQFFNDPVGAVEWQEKYS